MTGWSSHRGNAAQLRVDNIDTDQLIPARFMSTPRSAGYGAYLLHDVRDQFEIDAKDTILVAGKNFGSGSSREAAVYALSDFGIRVVIAPSFGDIFASNAVNNGVLPAQVAFEDLDTLTGEITVDLEASTLHANDMTVPFNLDPVWRLKLINGWDDIDLTTQHASAISDFAATRPKWSLPQTP